MHRAVIFANGDVPRLEIVRQGIRKDDFVIAADGGSRYALNIGRSPDVIIGDMDSIPPAVRESLVQSGARAMAFPERKDQTDLDLALDFALQEGYRQILIVGGLGGRLDHTLANIELLGRADLSACDVRMEDGHEEVMLISSQKEVFGKVGETVSLLPQDDRADGVTTEGLEYPLRDETLFRNQTRGVSNRLAGSKAIIRVKTGRLICIHTRAE